MITDHLIKQPFILTKPPLTFLLFVFYPFLFTVGTFTVQAQDQSQEAGYLHWFDERVGIENTALYDGIIYRETYRTINEKVKFYKSSLWLNGSVTYSGQFFPNLQLKYDVFGDQLIVKQLDRLGGGAILLFKDQVSGFAIEETSFVNVKQVPGNSEVAGYYELLWNDHDTRLLGRHLKNDFLKKDRSASYYEFVDLKKQYVLDIEGKYHTLKGKKELIKIFPELKQEIDSFYQKNKRLRSRDLDAFMVSLLNSLNQNLPKTSQ